MPVVPAQAANPANPVETAKPKVERKRIPMSIPQRTLEVPEIQGYHLHWFVDRNVPRALQAGYEFVTEEDGISPNQFGVGNDKSLTGNASLGSHIQAVGGEAKGGGTEYLTLMKIPEQFWLEDQAVLEQRNAQIMGAIFRGEKIIDSGSPTETEGDKAVRYVKEAKISKPLFQRPTRKGDK